MTKRSMSKQRKRKSNKGAFDSEEDYKRFAEKRNAATKKCRRKIAEERKLLREENAGLREEMELLRVEGGRLGDLYWKNKAEELRKELKGEISWEICRLITRYGSNSWKGFCCLCFCPFCDPDKTCFVPAGQASKFLVVESSFLSQQNSVHLPHLVQL